MSAAWIAAAVAADEERRMRDEEDNEERRCLCRKGAWNPDCPVHGKK